MCSKADAASSSRRVSPFGHPRIPACLQLPEAYRSLLRPSSSADAKASIVRSFPLDQTILAPACNASALQAVQLE